MSAALLLPIRIMLLILLPVVACAEGEKAAAASQDAPAPEGYHVYQSVQIDPEVSGFDGFLQLLQDKRLEGINSEERRGDPEFMWCRDLLSELEDFCASIKERPFLPAMVRLVRLDGSVANSRTMERSLASMASHHLYGSKKPTYFITVDYSIGMGSYNGPITFLVELSSGKLQWLKALTRRLVRNVRSLS